MKPLHIARALTIVLIIAASGCGREKSAPRTAINPMDATAAPVAGMAHGDHNPKYGGVVLMNGDLHFEVVANAEGTYAVYFSDAVRQELPASAVSEVRLSIVRPGFRGEPVEMKISDTGESWVGRGGNVDDRDTTLRILFNFQGQQRISEMPFFAAEAMKAGK
jgi:hypothetical protein